MSAVAAPAPTTAPAPQRSWLLGPLPARGLAAVRIATGAYAVGLVLGRGPSQLDLARAGTGWDPVGVARLLGDAPGAATVGGLLAVSLVATVAATLGWHHRWSGPAAFLAALTVGSLASSWGHLFHSDDLVVLHLAVLALAPAADAWSLDTRAGRRRAGPPSGRYGLPVRVAALVTAATYVLAGLAKLRLGGWGWLDGDTLRTLVAHDNLRKELIGAPSTPLAGPVVRQAWLFGPLAWATFAVELGAPLALVGRRWAQVWCTAAWCFHVGIAALMTVTFLYPLLLVAVLPTLVATDALPARWRERWWVGPARGGVVRRVLTGAAVWLLVAAVVRLVLLAPEGCRVPGAVEVDRAVTATLGWFEANQQPTGRFTYAYRRDLDRVEDARELVRHQGVLLSLYQAAEAGRADALAVADRGLAWSRTLLVPAGGGRAVARPGEPAETGAAALLLAALAERRLATQDGGADELMVALGRFLVGQVGADGSVSARWVPGEGAVDEHSPFFTGEAMWALARLGAVDPDGPWTATAQRIGAYLPDDRPAKEGGLPFVPDHWASYAFGELAEAGHDLPARQVAYARRLAGLFDTGIRFESQNRGRGVIARTRGAPSLGAGVGTLGEGAGGLQRLAEADDRLADLRAPIRGTVGCVAAVLVDRQQGPDDVRPGQDPDLVVGAWFRHDRTQLDDQQHALSALLAAEAVGATDPPSAPGHPRHEDHGGVDGWLALTMTTLVAADLGRRRGRAGPGGRRGGAGTLTAFAAAGLAAVVAGPWLADVLEVSEPTLRVGAGVVVLLTAVADLVDPRRIGPVVLRPGPLLVLAVGALDPGRTAALGALVAVLVLGPLAGLGVRGERWVTRTRWLAAAAVVLGADLVVDGIFQL